MLQANKVSFKQNKINKELKERAKWPTEKAFLKPHDAQCWIQKLWIVQTNNS